jgi:hypothetical protein
MQRVDEQPRIRLAHAVEHAEPLAQRFQFHVGNGFERDAETGRAVAVA